MYDTCSVEFKPSAIFWLVSPPPPLFCSPSNPWKDSIVTSSLPECLSGNKTTPTAFLRKEELFFFLLSCHHGAVFSKQLFLKFSELFEQEDIDQYKRSRSPEISFELLSWSLFNGGKFFWVFFFFCFPVTYVNIAQNSSMVIIYYCILFAVKSTSQMWIKERENLPNFLACFGFKAHSEIYCENVHTNILDVCVSSSGTWWCLLEFFISRSRGHQQLCLHTLTVTGPWRIAKSLRKVR